MPKSFGMGPERVSSSNEFRGKENAMFKANLVKFCMENLYVTDAVKVAAIADELEEDRTFVFLVERWADEQKSRDRYKELALWNAINDVTNESISEEEYCFLCDNEQDAAVVVLNVLQEVYHVARI